MTKKKKKSVKKDRQEKRLQCLSEKEQQKIDDIAECLAETEYQIKWPVCDRHSYSETTDD